MIDKINKWNLIIKPGITMSSQIDNEVAKINKGIGQKGASLEGLKV